jgi:hypothetical protein
VCAIDRRDTSRVLGQDVEVRVALTRAVFEEARSSS